MTFCTGRLIQGDRKPELQLSLLFANTKLIVKASKNCDKRSCLKELNSLSLPRAAQS